MSFLPSNKCPICNEELQSSEHRLDPNLMDKGYIKTWICPTKVLVPILDLVKQKHHYEANVGYREFVYPPYVIFIWPFEDNRTDIWIYQENEKPKLLLSLDAELELPWDDNAAVLEKLKLFHTFL